MEQSILLGNLILIALLFFYQRFEKTSLSLVFFFTVTQKGTSAGGADDLNFMVRVIWSSYWRFKTRTRPIQSPT
jgi:hypothetical protein